VLSSGSMLVVESAVVAGATCGLVPEATSCIIDRKVPIIGGGVRDFVS